MQALLDRPLVTLEDGIRRLAEYPSQIAEGAVPLRRRA
jgi:hypothetical protein